MKFLIRAFTSSAILISYSLHVRTKFVIKTRNIAKYHPLPFTLHYKTNKFKGKICGSEASESAGLMILGVECESQEAGKLSKE